MPRLRYLKQREDVRVTLDLRAARDFTIELVGQRGERVEFTMRNAGGAAAAPIGVLSRIRTEASDLIGRLWQQQERDRAAAEAAARQRAEEAAQPQQRLGV
jgi:hypothetical protein